MKTSPWLASLLALACASIVAPLSAQSRGPLETSGERALQSRMASSRVRLERLIELRIRLDLGIPPSPAEIASHAALPGGRAPGESERLLAVEQERLARLSQRFSELARGVAPPERTGAEAFGPTTPLPGTDPGRDPGGPPLPDREVDPVPGGLAEPDHGASTSRPASRPADFVQVDPGVLGLGAILSLLETGKTSEAAVAQQSFRSEQPGMSEFVAGLSAERAGDLEAAEKNFEAAAEKLRAGRVASGFATISRAVDPARAGPHEMEEGAAPVETTLDARGQVAAPETGNAAVTERDLRAGFEAFQQAAARLTESYEALRHRVAEMDIELAETNRRLRESLEEREAVLALLPVGVVATDSAGEVRWDNAEARRILGAGDGRDLLTGDGSAMGVRVESSAVRTKVAPMPGGGRLVVLEDRSRIESLERQVLRLDRLAALSELAFGIAHELRNPLNAVTGFAGLLRRAKDLAQVQRVGRQGRGGRASGGRDRPQPARVRAAGSRQAVGDHTARAAAGRDAVAHLVRGPRPAVGPRAHGAAEDRRGRRAPDPLEPAAQRPRGGRRRILHPRRGAVLGRPDAAWT